MQDVTRGDLVRHSRTLRAGAIAFSVLVCAVSFGCQTAVRAPAPSDPATPYLVGPPDHLQVTVLPEPVIERQMTVRPDGFITVDLVGDVMASGRTPREIAADIQKRMGRFKRDAAVSVAVVAALSDSITVLGEVREPGTFALERDMRLAEAIGARGGPTKFAAESKVRIVRMQDGEATVISANIAQIQRGDLSSNIMLRKGDLVVVPPTVLARIGYTLSSLLFPLSPILSAGAGVGLASLF